MKTIIPAVTNLAKTVSARSQNGQSAVPRFLYHITSKKNYESMLKDGFIRTSQDAADMTNLNGVFMFDLKNFTKRWCNTGFSMGDDFLTLAKSLFLKGSSKTSNIVVLKVPTKKLTLVYCFKDIEYCNCILFEWFENNNLFDYFGPHF